MSPNERNILRSQFSLPTMLSIIWSVGIYSIVSIPMVGIFLCSGLWIFFVGICYTYWHCSFVRGS